MERGEEDECGNDYCSVSVLNTQTCMHSPSNHIHLHTIVFQTRKDEIVQE